MTKLFSVFILILALTACAPAPATVGEPVATLGEIAVYDAWARGGLSDVTGAFMQIRNTGASAERLVGASSTVAATVEVHETSMADGIMSMREVEFVEIAPGGIAELKPGGYHIMLIGISEALKSGETIIITLQFENAGALDVPVLVKMP
jgi:periplasmic copper chaperone A